MMNAYKAGWLEKQCEKRYTWSEEDIRNIQDIDSILFYDRLLTEDIRTKLRNFLKSLKDGIQPKQEWSEEDDYAIEKLLCLLDNEQDNYPQLSCDFQELEEIKDWLKSLKPQNRWKPSDLQLEALESAYKQLPNIQHFLQSLYNDLKKL